MKVLLASLFCSAVLHLCSSTVCLPTWTLLRGVYSFNGEFIASITRLQDCLIACERRASCLAIDFFQSVGMKPSCWLHSSADQLTGDNFRNQTLYSDKAQYRIQRNCSDQMDEDNVVDWTVLSNTTAGYGIEINYWTEYDCFTFCRYRSDCVAVDFDPNTQPPCWWHMDASELNPDNVYSTPNVVQYRLNKTNAATETKQVGRCVGQWFPNATWCQPGAVIYIRSASFKDNPLCPVRNSDDAHPPDSSTIANIIIQYLDLNYYREIQACNGSTQCYLRAKCPYASTYSEPCQDSPINANFVAISYSCFSNDRTTSTSTVSVRPTPVRSSTTQPIIRTTATQLPSAAVETMASTKIIIGTKQTVAAATQTPSTRETTTAFQAPTGARKTPTKQSSGPTEPSAEGELSNATHALVASEVGTEPRKDYKNVIIGVVVGFGVPLIAITIIVIVFFVVRERRSKKKALEANDNVYVAQSYYENSTFQRGSVPDNEINEVSMNVDTM